VSGGIIAIDEVDKHLQVNNRVDESIPSLSANAIINVETASAIAPNTSSICKYDSCNRMGRRNIKYK